MNPIDHSATSFVGLSGPLDSGSRQEVRPFFAVCRYNCGMQARQNILICFILVALIGLACLVLGPALDTTYPHFQLDVVLSPEEIKDPIVREETLEMLKRHPRRDAPYWILLGLGLFAVSGFGIYWTVKSTPPRPSTHSEGKVKGHLEEGD
jgi:hypothetical protein